MSGGVDDGPTTVNKSGMLDLPCSCSGIVADFFFPGLSRNAIFSAVNASLKRLEMDYIDLLQIHRFDPNTRPEETMRALDDLVRSGK